MAKSTLKFNEGVKDGLPIGLGYLSVSFAFGVTASSLGIPYFLSVLISMTNLTSAGQLAGISVNAAAGTVLEIILTQLVINSRYFLMGLSLTQKTDEDFRLPSRLFCAFGITDEFFAVAISKKGLISKNYFRGLMLLPYLGWAIGTLLGSVAGNLLPTELIMALGVGLYAMFMAIIVPPAKKERGVLFTVCLSAVLSCLLYYVPVINTISTGFKYIISALVSATITALIFPIKEVQENA